MIAAFFKALLEVVAELLKGEIKKKKTAVDADAPPETLRGRFRRKLKQQLRNGSGGVH